MSAIDVSKKSFFEPCAFRKGILSIVMNGVQKIGWRRVPLIDLDYRRAFDDDPGHQVIVRAASARTIDGRLYRIATHHQRSLFPQDEVGPQLSRLESHAVVAGESFAEQDAGFAEDASIVTKRREDAVTRVVAGFEKRRRLAGPGPPGYGVGFRFLPGNPSFGTRIE